MNKKITHIVTVLLVLYITSFSQYLDTAYVNINRIKMPLINNGTLGEVHGGVIYDSNYIMHSAGFFLSGKNYDSLWSNGVQDSDEWRDYLPGSFNSDPNNKRNKFYELKSSDEQFGSSWIEWQNAVELGAYFYDGNNDGLYDPLDLNGNGLWDPEEDRPDLIGDVTIWNVINDGVPKEERSYKDVSPQGIEIKQTVFAYYEDNNDIINNVIFIRYIIDNTGVLSNKFDSVYFGVPADNDIGDYGTDFTGCDTIINSVFAYKKYPDSDYEDNPPSLLITLLQGPVVTATSNDQSVIRRGPYLGEEVINNSKNLQMISSLSYGRANSPLTRQPRNKSHLRNYLLGGRYTEGDSIIVREHTFGNGDSLGNEADIIPPEYMYSGDPVKGEGWLNIIEYDQRILISSGPFTLEKHKPVELIYAYIVGRGDSPLNSVTVAKNYTREIQKFYESNFTELPVGVKDEPKKVIPSEFKLYQNYPNPFNPATSIQYSIPVAVPSKVEGNHVTLKVYDILGREVATLVNKEQTPGIYEVKFNASHLPSGVYFYTLKVNSTENSFVKTKKLILMK